MSDWSAVVMAAGAGSRMRSRRPKVLHTVAGKPMLRWVIDAVAGAEIPHTVVVVAPGADEVRAAAGPDAAIAIQEQRAGTADAVRSAKDACSSARQVLVLNGDLPLLRPETLQALCRRHEKSGAPITLLTAITDTPAGLARIERGHAGEPVAIVEERDAGPETLAIREINAGVYCFWAAWLWPHLHEVQRSPVTGELYLTDLVRMAVAEGEIVETVTADADEVRGVNSRAELAEAERIARARVCEALFEAGVSLVDPATTYIDATVRVCRDTVLHPNTIITGDTDIGEDCQIGPNTIIRSSRIGDGSRILSSVIEDSTVGAGVAIGPFSHVRDGAHIETGAHLGNYAEVKKSRIGAGTQMHHFSYIGDAQVGRGVNIGAGTITCNYDGTKKHETIIGEGAFIGSDTMLVAPVTVGDGGRTGAGSVVTRNVAPGTTVVGVPARPFSSRNEKQKEVS